MLIRITPDMSTFDINVPIREIIIYFILMYFLGVSTIILYLKAKDKYDDKAKWVGIAFNAWSLFIAPFIYFWDSSFTFYGALIATLGIALIISIFSAISMSILMLTAMFINKIFGDEERDPYWLTIPIFWILGVLIGLPIWYAVFSS